MCVRIPRAHISVKKKLDLQRMQRQQMLSYET